MLLGCFPCSLSFESIEAKKAFKWSGKWKAAGARWRLSVAGTTVNKVRCSQCGMFGPEKWKKKCSCSIALFGIDIESRGRLEGCLLSLFLICLNVLEWFWIVDNPKQTSHALYFTCREIVSKCIAFPSTVIRRQEYVICRNMLSSLRVVLHWLRGQILSELC